MPEREFELYLSLLTPLSAARSGAAGADCRRAARPFRGAFRGVAGVGAFARGGDSRHVGRIRRCGRSGRRLQSHRQQKKENDHAMHAWNRGGTGGGSLPGSDLLARSARPVRGPRGPWLSSRRLAKDAALPRRSTVAKTPGTAAVEAKLDDRRVAEAGFRGSPAQGSAGVSSAMPIEVDILVNPQALAEVGRDSGRADHAAGEANGRHCAHGAGAGPGAGLQRLGLHAFATD